jgi:hypothetical protein
MLYRVHEWLADHVSWVQYPNQRVMPAREPGGLHWETRVLIGLGSMSLLLAALLVFCACMLLFWAMLTA